jgi:pyruvate/2-oxoglutarate dehydrogenase complex dihydrolipoamide dehydrogenase (E3) component
MTEEEAREEGIDVAATTLELPEMLARSTTYEKKPRGTFGLVVDRTERVRSGRGRSRRWRGEWIHQACLAVRGRTPVDTLLDCVFQFPISPQAYLEALEQLDL